MELLIIFGTRHAINKEPYKASQETLHTRGRLKTVLYV